MPSGSTTLLPGGFAVQAQFALSAATGHHRSQTMLESPAERPEEQGLFEAWQKKSVLTGQHDCPDPRLCMEVVCSGLRKDLGQTEGSSPLHHFSCAPTVAKKVGKD